MIDFSELEDLQESQMHKAFSEMLEAQPVHPYFSPDATEHEKKFMLRKVHPSTLRYATMMHVVAPKVCEKCDKSLKIPELCWREEQNIVNFLCYKCIGVLEKEKATMEHDGCGRWVLKTLQKELPL